MVGSHAAVGNTAEIPPTLGPASPTVTWCTTVESLAQRGGLHHTAAPGPLPCPRHPPACPPGVDSCHFKNAQQVEIETFSNWLFQSALISEDSPRLLCPIHSPRVLSVSGVWPCHVPSYTPWRPARWRMCRSLCERRLHFCGTDAGSPAMSWGGRTCPKRPCPAVPTVAVPFACRI